MRTQDKDIGLTVHAVEVIPHFDLLGFRAQNHTYPKVLQPSSKITRKLGGL